MDIKRFLLGKPLRTNELHAEKLSRFWGVPIMASDAVSSVAYAIEEILLVLVPVLGISAILYLDIVAIPIILLLLVLAFSYSQIIHHYPNGGGAYIVSKENIGRKTSLVAASALIIDYIMTVAVSLSSATSAVLAAFPDISEYRVPIALIFVSLVTLLNLRGISESSKIFGIPTYGFILIMGILIITGLIGIASGTVSSIVYENSPSSVTKAMDPVFIFLLLKAFSSGCSALTGIEAVSNAVPSFRDPAARNAKHVLYILAGIIVFIFGGSVILATSLKVIPISGQTVISQMGEAVFGNSVLFYILQFATSLILILAANTAYSGLPTLLSLLASEGYLPRQFAQRGAKLSFSNGILFIFFTAGLLLIIFQADTHHLIPLYSVGVFLSFTLSQSGMVVKLIKSKEKGWKHRFLINGLGALMTLIGTLIVFLTKFIDGAWMLAVAIPVISIIMGNIKKHYEFIRIQNQLSADDFEAYYHKSISANKNQCMVLVSSVSRSVLKSLNYANATTSNVTALHISTNETQTKELKAKWKEYNIDVPLKIIQAPYRDIVPPFEKYISKMEQKLNPGEDISVVMIKFVEKRWYDNFLHNQTTYFIERTLRTHKNVVTVIVPYLYYSKNKRGKRRN